MSRSRVALALCLTAIVLAPADAAPQTDRADRRRTPVVEVFEAARGAVVNISSTEIVNVRSGFGFSSLFEDLFDMPRGPRTRQLRRTSVGSGFVVHGDGYIVTNAHVVARTVERRVGFADGRDYDAQIVAVDTEHDIAVLKIDAESVLSTLPLGRSDDLMIGESVIAIGNPLGYQHTVTAGVVSAVGRELEVSEDVTFTDLIQTDASINPGNSGGPLLNVLGELIGINTAIRGDAQNIGFAIPVDALRDPLPALLDAERRNRIVSGLTLDSLHEPRVLAVEPGSPAAAAGVEVGDVLVAIDRRPVHHGIDYDFALLDHEPGDEVSLSLRRRGAAHSAVIRLARRPEPDGARLTSERLGLVLEPLPEHVARGLGLPRAAGLVVVAVEPDSPAAALGVEGNDVLLAIGRHYVSTPEEIGHLLETLHGGDRLSITILRNDRGRKVKLTGTLRVR